MAKKTSEPVRVVADGKGLKVVLPLTQSSGKVRVKERSFFYEYGMPFATRQKKLGLKNYVEWQISYDFAPKKGEPMLTSLDGMTFRDYAQKRKYAYELGEMLFYAHREGLLSDEDVANLCGQVAALPPEATFSEMDSLQICRTHPRKTTVNGLEFHKMEVKYPLLARRFGEYDIYAEVMVKEKQKGVGIQPMLYVCIPITSLVFAKNAIGRTLDAKETAEWTIGSTEAALVLELFRIFGMLSPKHRHDILALLKMLFPRLAV